MLLPCTGATASEKTILVYGDSISAAYGMAQEEGWVSLLAARLALEEPECKLVNASVSGETTSGGMARLPKTLSLHQPDIMILELGGNDGLRGYPLASIRAGLDSIIRQTLDTGARVLLIGMVLPPNYGPAYTIGFERVFADLAKEHQLPFIPFLLDGTATPRHLIQKDGMHPNVRAQPRIMESVYRVLSSNL